MFNGPKSDKRRASHNKKNVCQLLVEKVCAKRRMKRYKYTIYILLAALVAACGSGREATTADSRYRRAPIHEVSEEELKVDGLLIDAMGLLQSGHTDEALAAYTRIANSAPQCADAWYEMSRLLMQRGWADSAAACAERAVAINPGNKWYLLHLAEVQHRRGQNREATATWEKIVAVEPKVLENYYRLSDAYIDADNAEGAVSALNRVEKMVGVTEMVSLQKQRIWTAVGKPDRAARELETLADAMPHEKLYQAILAEMYMSQKKCPKAKERYFRVLAADPDDEYIHIQLAEYYKQIGRPAEADSEMVRAFANPNLAASTKLQLLGSFYTEEEFYGSHSATAFRLLDMAMAQTDSPAQYAAFYGQVLLRQEKYPEAARQMETALKADSSRYEVWELLLVSLSEVPQRESDMVAYASRAERLFPMQTLPKYLIAISLARNEKWAEALEKLESAAKWGFNKGYLEAECTGLMAECAYRSGQYDKAWPAYDRYLELRPDDWNMLNNYAYELALEGLRLEEALDMSRHTLEAQPQNANNLDTYGWILHLLGRDAEALPYIERALRLEPTNDTLREHYKALKK